MFKRFIPFFGKEVGEWEYQQIIDEAYSATDHLPFIIHSLYIDLPFILHSSSIR